jgi:hypothetical protein
MAKRLEMLYGVRVIRRVKGFLLHLLLRHIPRCKKRVHQQRSRPAPQRVALEESATEISARRHTATHATSVHTVCYSATKCFIERPTTHPRIIMCTRWTDSSLVNGTLASASYDPL